MISTDHLQSDGQKERVNQIIEDMLRSYVGAKPTKWERYLPNLEFPSNSSKHTSTGNSPFMLMYGFQSWASIDVNIHHDELRSTQNFLQDMQDMLHITRDNIKATQDRVRFYADHNRKSRVFSPGQKVFLRVPHNSKPLSMGKCAKLAPWFCGPFTVLKRIGSSSLSSRSSRWCWNPSSFSCKSSKRTFGFWRQYSHNWNSGYFRRINL